MRSRKLGALGFLVAALGAVGCGDSGGSTTGSSGGASGNGGATGLPFGSPCSMDSQCLNGKCASGYCTVSITASGGAPTGSGGTGTGIGGYASGIGGYATGLGGYATGGTPGGMGGAATSKGGSTSGGFGGSSSGGSTGTGGSSFTTCNLSMATKPCTAGGSCDATDSMNCRHVHCDCISGTWACSSYQISCGTCPNPLADCDSACPTNGVMCVCYQNGPNLRDCTCTSGMWKCL
ncbi:MAG TPA: hypothetical protein VGJ84_05325 [Polyangiaceae bacterium]|jgi:hypothetical protein